MADLADPCLGRAARACFELCRCGWCGEKDECLPRANGSECPGFEPARCSRPYQWAEAGAVAVIFALMLATFAFTLVLVCREWCCPRPRGRECGVSAEGAEGLPGPADPAMRLTLHRDSDDSPGDQSP